jgi:hypothetical protein
MKRMFTNGRYANVTATLALIVALSGTSYAAVRISNNSITSAKIKNHSLRAVDIKKGQHIDVHVRYGTGVELRPGMRQTVTAACRPGERALSGGPLGGGDVFDVITSAPAQASNLTPNGWLVSVVNTTSGTGISFDAYVICARA